MTKNLSKKASVLGLFLALLFGFQNCGQAPELTSGEMSSNQLRQATESDGSLKNISLQEKVDVIEIPESPELEQSLSELSSKSTTAGRLFISKTLMIYPQTGLIEVVDAQDGEAVGQQFCLSDEQGLELQGILAAAKICEEQTTQDENMACTMDYEFPYAKLHLLNQKVNLGERFSGCHRGTDLCGEYGNLMKSFVSQIKSNLDKMTCQFENL